MASTDARPVPRKNVAYRVTFPILDADGDLVTAAAALDSEVSKDGDTFADATSEATEIATSSGMYFLDLTATEMNADTVAVIVKTSTTGAKTTVIVMYPEEIGDYRADVQQWVGVVPGALISGRVDSSVGAMATDVLNSGALATDAVDELVDAVWNEARSGHTTAGTFGQASQLIRDGTAQAGAASSITLDSGASSVTDFYKGCWIALIGTGTGTGQARLITAYNGTTKVATVVPDWATNPNATSQFIILPVSGVDLRLWLGIAVNALISGRVDANAQVVGDKTGYTLTTAADGSIADAVWDEVIAELAQAQPATTPTARALVMLLYMALRNDSAATASERRIKNDAGTVVTKAPLADDGTTFTQGKLVTGP